jgi:hypothetical protein
MRSLSLISHSAENANHEQEQLASWAPCCTSVLYYSKVASPNKKKNEPTENYDFYYII